MVAASVGGSLQMPHSPSCPTPCSLWGVTPSGCMGPEELGNSREALGFLHLGPSHTENSPFLEPLLCQALGTGDAAGDKQTLGCRGAGPLMGGGRH